MRILYPVTTNEVLSVNAVQRRIRSLIGPIGNAKGATQEALLRLKELAPFPLPSDYLAFLEMFNGAEGFLGASYVRLWKAEELKEDNDGYLVLEAVPDLFLIGSNGGGEAYGIRFNGDYIQIPFIVLSLEDSYTLGRSFTEALERLFLGSIIGSEWN